MDVGSGVTDPKHLQHAGKTILEQLWDQAVVQYGILTEMHKESGKTYELGVQTGKTSGLAYAIAKLLNPNKPDVEDVKKLIRERWKADQEEEEE